MTTEFHFSPRPNRAAEIDWQPWSAQTFARAQREDKPILLSISAVWCHWCHVMDETTYSNEAVIETINDRYIPVRVDNDERPDVNARYNMGGWPTTAFLSPEGTLLTGATYLPPSEMERALGQVAEFYDERKSDIAEKEREIRSAPRSYDIAPPEALSPALVADFAEALRENYDEEFGGFNEAPKFPQPEVFEFLLAYWHLSGDARYYEIVAHTMRAMAHGGMYDPVEGGFFRYSTTRDWTIPHFEKMAEDHAGLLRVLADLELWAPSELVRSDVSNVRLRTCARCCAIRRPGSSPAAKMRMRSITRCRVKSVRSARSPFVDRRSYSNWTAGLAGAFAWSGIALEDRTLIEESLQTLDAMHERLRDDDGLLYHVLTPGEPPRIRGLLEDQVAYVRALLDAYEISGEARMLDRARTHTDATIARVRGTRRRLLRPCRSRLARPARTRPIGRSPTMALWPRICCVWERCCTRPATAMPPSGPCCCTPRRSRARRRSRRPMCGHWRATSRTRSRFASPAASRRGHHCAAPPGSCLTLFAVESHPSGETAAYLCEGTTCRKLELKH